MAKHTHKKVKKKPENVPNQNKICVAVKSYKKM